MALAQSAVAVVCASREPLCCNVVPARACGRRAFGLIGAHRRRSAVIANAGGAPNERADFTTLGDAEGEMDSYEWGVTDGHHTFHASPDDITWSQSMQNALAAAGAGAAVMAFFALAMAGIIATTDGSPRTTGVAMVALALGTTALYSLLMMLDTSMRAYKPIPADAYEPKPSGGHGGDHGDGHH